MKKQGTASVFRPLRLLGVLVLGAVLTACGGGGGGDTAGGDAGGGSTDTTPRYTVGGTVTGLVAGSVVLQNNGSNDLTLSADGSFTFATALNDGSAYKVTVLTQPVGLTCSVSTGVGTVSGNNVTNVAVVCAADAYDVGGSVSGLAGMVVLRNNSGDDLIVDADGSFTFASPVANGSPYSVTVHTQPADQSCSIVNGTGTVAGVDVTNIGITCATDTYTVGGTVAGLVGTVVLQNNGGDNLTVAASGAFTFGTAPETGSAYAVTVLSQPVGQTCTVANGTGTISGAHVTNVSVTCASTTYTVGASAGTGGGISPASATVKHGATTSFTVTPATGYSIDGVSGCGGTLSGNTYTTGAITANCTVSASFNIKTYTVGVSDGAGGSISPASATVNHGATTSFTVTPATGYSIGSVSGCGGTLSGNTYTTGAITADCSVSASFNINTYSVGASAGTGGSISPANAIINHGATTSFIVTPATGYSIGSVSGCGGTLNGNTYTTGAVTANCTVSANFNINTYSVGASAGTGGSIGPASATVNHGATTSFIITPATGYSIGPVSGCGGTLSGNTYTTGAVTANCTVSASFNINTYTVGASAAANGSISPTSATVNHGATTSFIITPATGYSIGPVSGCGGTLSGSTYTTGAITANCTVSASFNINTYSVGTSAGTGGSISPASATVNHGVATSFTVTPATGYSLGSVSGCGGTLSGNTYTTGAVTANCTVSASFNINTYTVGAGAGANGSISPASATVNHGATTSFTVTPDLGYGIDSVMGCGGTLSGSTYTTGAITANCSVSASFSAMVLDAEAQQGAVTLSWADSGAASYNLYYASAPGCDIANYSLCPDGTLITNVTAPYTVTGLTNGQNYWFQLEAGGAGTVSREAGAHPDILVPNGAVRAIAQDASGTTYLGGEFTRFGVRSDHGVPLSRTSGLPGAYPLVNGAIYAAAADGAGGFYIGGYFTEVGGVPRNRLAHIRADGTLGDWNPGANNWVNALSVVGNTIYAGGQFTSVGGQARNRLAAIDTDGTLSDWNPNANGQVNALAVAGDTVYAGGSFSSVGGQTRNNLAAIGTDGTLRPWSPDVNSDDPWSSSDVKALAVAGGVVYVGGNFTSVGEQPRNNLAAIGTDGALLPWNPEASNTVNALAVVGDTVYAGGWFESVGGQTRSALAAIGTDGTLSAWNPGVNSYGYVYALAVAGDTVYAGGQFTNVGGQTRHRLAAIGTDGTLRTWNPGAGGEVRALAVAGDAVYAGGWVTCIGGQTRNRLAALDTDGALSAWNPDANSLVNALVVVDDTVYAGGDFTSVGGQVRNYLAAVGADGTLSDWNPNANSLVRALAVAGDTVYAGGRFTSVGDLERKYLAAIGTDGMLRAWNPGANTGDVYALAVADDTVYAGGQFTSVGGQTRERLAAIGTDGVLRAWNPGASSTVHALAVAGGTVYAGGYFGSVGGQTRNYLAAIGTNGTLSAWNPGASSTVTALTVADGTVYAGGGFTSIGGQPRNRLAAIGPDGTIRDWNPDAGGSVLALAVVSDTVYAGGVFTSIGGELMPYFVPLTPAPRPILLYQAGARNGNLGGRTGADSLCANAMHAMCGTRTNVHAFLSVSIFGVPDVTPATDSIVNLASNFGLASNVPILSTSGVTIGNNWADLDGSIPQSLVSAGVLPSGARWWSGSNEVGGTFGAAMTSCSGWSTSANGAMDKGAVGSGSQTDFRWLVDGTVSPGQFTLDLRFCNESHYLLCVCGE
jgi:hypothetical protein